MEFAIVDIETTGLVQGMQGITEIAVIIHDGQRILETWEQLVNPQLPIHPKVSALTGIDSDMLINSPSFKDLIPELERLTLGRCFVAHNVGFDYKVIGSMYAQAGARFDRSTLCTVRLARQFIPGLASYSLGRLCADLNIPLENRHRAMGDALATAKLFEFLFGRHEEAIKKKLKRNSGVTNLPSHMDADSVQNLPEKPGVYYFRDKTGKILYVGKAVNIKKRVISHFYDRKASEIGLSRETRTVDYELSGNELLSLLMEASEIKKHYPPYNRAQKRGAAGYGITTYENREGIVQLIYNTRKLIAQPLKVAYSITACREILQEVCDSFELCPRYTQLMPGSGSCETYYNSRCKGVCRGEETISDYNRRVMKAIEELRGKAESYLILGKGRTEGEQAVVWVEQGIYRGYAFVPEEEGVSCAEQLEPYFKRQQMTEDVMGIINQQLKSNSALKRIDLPSRKDGNAD